ncbi:hypothetical protein Tco_1423486, partial [Tanacetum coccineum]
DDLYLAFALGVGIPWGHRSLIPGIAMLQEPSDHSGGGVQEEMHLLDNNVVLDRAWFTLARGAMAQAHALCQFESLYDTHHALQESLETTRSHLVRTREDFNVVQNFYNTLSEKHRKLREDHDHCSEGLAAVRAEKDSLMATNAEQALRIKELEQQIKSADEVHYSAVKDLEGQLAQKDSALVYAERVSSDRLSENEDGAKMLR